MLVFIHINKTAGSTVRYILRSSYGPHHCEIGSFRESEAPFSGAELKGIYRLDPKLRSIAGHRVTGYGDLEGVGVDIDYFTFIREPLKMCASRFQYHVDYRKKTGIVFEEWIRRERLRNAQTKRICGSDDVKEAIRIIEQKQMFVGLTERFDESMVMLKALRAPDLDIGYQRVNTASRNTLADELLANDSSRRLLIEANEADLAMYEYASTVAYPRMKELCGPRLEQMVIDFKAGQPAQFNRLNMALFRLKQHGFYRPMMGLYRGERTRRIAKRLLG